MAAMLDQALVSGVNFATALLVARVLSLTLYGYYSLLFAVLLFVNNMQTSLLAAPLMVFAQRYTREEQQRYFRNLWVVQIVICVVVGVLGTAVLAGGAMWWQELLQNASVAAIMLTLVTYLGQEFVRRMMFAKNDTIGAFIADAISYGGQFVAIILLLLLHISSLDAVFWSMGITSLCAVVFGVFRTRLSLRGVQRHDVWQTWLEHWRYGVWLMNGSVAQWLSGQLYQFIIAPLLTVSANGLFNAGKSLLSFSNVMMLGLENFVPATMTRRYIKNGLNDMIRWNNRFRVALIVVMGLFSLAMAVFARELIVLIVGPKYAGAEAVVPFLAAVYFAQALNRPSMFALRVLKATRWTFYAHCSSAVVTLLIAYPLVNNYGITGASMGMLISQLIVLAVASFGYRRVLKQRRAEEASTQEAIAAEAATELEERS